MNWSEWKDLPSPQNCRKIEGPEESGVYQLLNAKTNEFILFGISNKCRKRMKSLYPKPFGIGTRNNSKKREYVLMHWQNIKYRTLETPSRIEAKLVEDKIRNQNNHLFNT